MTTLRLNTEPLHEGQAESLRLILEERVDRLYVLPGRGFGKSHAIIVAAFAIAAQTPRRRVLITYPTQRDCYDIGGDKISEIIPDDVYTWRKGDMTATLWNGSAIVLRHRSTATQNRNMRKKGRGQTNHAVFHDEAAIDESPTACHNFNATVRGPGSMGVYYFTTPVVGWLKDEVDSFGIGESAWGVHRGEKTVTDDDGDHIVRAAALYARTRDNVYGGAELHRTMLADLDERTAAQELDGQWVALTGRIWDNWSDEQWPAGNVHEAGYDPRAPWVLSCDFGAARSSWIAWQRFGGVDVAVAEWHPESGGAAQSLQTIMGQMRTPPSAVYSGHDLHTRSVADSSVTPAYFVRKALGHSVPLIGLAGAAMDMRVRHDKMRGAIKPMVGPPRLAISRRIRSYDPNGRGIRRVVEQDAWPDGTVRAGGFLPKDGRLEHCRDAIHHYIAMVRR